MSQSYYGSTDPQSTPGTSGLLTYSNFNAVNAPYLKSTGSASFQTQTAVSLVATSCVNAQTATLSSALNTVNIVATSCASIPILNSTNTVAAVNITAESIASTSAQFTQMGASSATLADVSSTNLITANRVASSSGQFTVLGASSATLSQVSSTHSITLQGNFVHKESPTISTVIGTCAMPASDNVPNSGFTILSSSSGDINRYYLQAPTCGARATIQFRCGLTTDNIAYLFLGATNSTAITVGCATCGNIAIKSCGFSPEISLYGVTDTRWIIISQSTYSEGGGTITAVSSSCS